MNRLPFLGQGSKVREAGASLRRRSMTGRCADPRSSCSRGAQRGLASLKMVCLGGNLLLVSFKRCVPPVKGAVRTMVGKSVLFR